MAFYRKVPVVIEARQLTASNHDHLVTWINHSRSDFGAQTDGVEVLISTLEGQMRAGVGDWIIKGINGEFYPCKPDIFEATYEEVIDAYTPVVT